ncbi:MAG: hypothetical protein RL205_981, partial [Actinomycetota bacterium]
MSLTATVAVLPPGVETLEFESVRVPDPGPFEVVVEMRAAGVCHSQLDVIDRRDRTNPLVMGHEGFGVAIAVGDQVRSVAPGDEVFLTWLPRTPDARKAIPGGVDLSDGRRATTHNVYAWGTHCVVDEQYLVRALAGEIPPALGAIVGCAVMTGAGAVLNVARPTSADS